MTTIAANKEFMASDSQATGGSIKTSVQKFWRVRGWLIGCCGTYSDIMDVMEEIKSQAEKNPCEVLKSTKFPKVECDLLILSPSGKLYESEGATTPWPVQEGHAAIGSGSQGAMVALNMGLSPKEAIREVRKVDPSTGGRIVTRKI